MKAVMCLRSSAFPKGIDPKRHKDEFSRSSDFGNMRNRIGGLLLLPKSSNSKSALMQDLLTGHVSADAIERSTLTEITT